MTTTTMMMMEPATRTELSATTSSPAPPPPVTGGTPHGIKRRASQHPETTQRLAKRFNLLNLDNQQQANNLSTPLSNKPNGLPPSSTPANSSSTTTAKPDIMQLEDRPDKIYILDLDAELADTESPSSSTNPTNPTTTSTPATPIFLPDIEAHLARLPPHILRAPDPSASSPPSAASLQPTPQNQLVLYRLPPSLTVPDASRDRVRQAILEARARVRDRQALRPGEFGGGGVGVSSADAGSGAVPSMSTPTPIPTPTMEGGQRQLGEIGVVLPEVDMLPDEVGEPPDLDPDAMEVEEEL